jgi:flagellar hook assembly protein FlgD
VYDAAGRLVRRLVDGARPAGLQRVRWDGDDSSGRRVGPGVYFVRVGASGEALTRKLVLRR